MQKVLIIIGIVFLIIGLLWSWLQKLHIGHLPGDIIIKRENFTFYFPLTTSIIVSIIFWLIIRLFTR